MCVLSAIINNVKRAAGPVVILAEKQEARILFYGRTIIN